jgi:hypothetical protein
MKMSNDTIVFLSFHKPHSDANISWVCLCVIFNSFPIHFKMNVCMLEINSIKNSKTVSTFLYSSPYLTRPEGRISYQARFKMDWYFKTLLNFLPEERSPLLWSHFNLTNGGYLMKGELLLLDFTLNESSTSTTQRIVPFLKTIQT